MKWDQSTWQYGDNATRSGMLAEKEILLFAEEFCGGDGAK